MHSIVFLCYSGLSSILWCFCELSGGEFSSLLPQHAYTILFLKIHPKQFIRDADYVLQKETSIAALFTVVKTIGNKNSQRHKNKMLYPVIKCYTTFKLHACSSWYGWSCWIRKWESGIQGWESCKAMHSMFWKKQSRRQEPEPWGISGNLGLMSSNCRNKSKASKQ